MIVNVCLLFVDLDKSGYVSLSGSIHINKHPYRCRIVETQIDKEHVPVTLNMWSAS